MNKTLLFVVFVVLLSSFVTSSVIIGSNNDGEGVVIDMINDLEGFFSNLFVGSDVETIDNPSFVLDGNDTFISDMLGVEGDSFFDSDLYVLGSIFVTNINNTYLNSSNATFCNVLTGKCVYINNGNIGIGSTSTGYALTVQGKSNISSDLNVSGNITLKQFLSCNIETDTTGNFICGVDDDAGTSTDVTRNITTLNGSLFWNQTTTSLFPKELDKVIGIGTNTPNTTATIEIEASIPHLMLTTKTFTNPTNLSFRQDVSGRLAGDLWQISTKMTNGGLNASQYQIGDLIISGRENVSIETSFLTERLRIKNNGNIGLSNNTPAERLSIQGNLSLRTKGEEVPLFISANNISLSPAMIMEMSRDGGAKIFQGRLIGDQFARISFEINAPKGVGIFFGNGTSRDTNLYRGGENILKTDDKIEINHSSGLSAYGNLNISSNAYIGWFNSQYTIFISNSTGKVGIRDPNPGYQLTVAGKVNISSDLNVSGRLIVKDNYYANDSTPGWTGNCDGSLGFITEVKNGLVVGCA